MGGWSIGFYRAGFDILGVDIVDVGYPYDLVKTDIRNFHASNPFDVVVASPPCTEFSGMTEISARKGQRPWPSPEKGMVLVREAQRVIKEANPKYWIIENVHGALKPFYPVFGPPKMRIGPWRLWGDFPKFLMPQANTEVKQPGGGAWQGHFDSLMAWKRAKVPLYLSIPIAKACASGLAENGKVLMANPEKGS